MELFSSFEFDGQPIAETNISHFLLNLQTPQVGKRDKRKPLNLSIVIDKSGSMAGEKLQNVKEAVKTFVKNLSAQDIISIIIFDNRVKLVRPAEPVKNKQEIYGIIDKITHGGTTNLSGGWEYAYQQVLSNDIPENINRIILLTDGHANEGIINKAVLLELGRKFAETNVETTTIGVGTDFDEELLKIVAKESKGNFYFVDNPDETMGIFKNEVGELLSLYAQNMILTLNFLNGVQLKKIYTDYIIQYQDDETLTLELDDSHSEDTKSILMKLDFPAVHELRTYEVIDVELRYRLLIPKIENKVSQLIVNRKILTKEDFLIQKPNEHVLLEIAHTKAAIARMESYYHLKSGDVDTASKTLTASSVELAEISQALKSLGLAESADSVNLESQALKIDDEDIANNKESIDKRLLFDSTKYLHNKKGKLFNKRDTKE